jgi:hypothetical protein
MKGETGYLQYARMFYKSRIGRTMQIGVSDKLL